MNNNRPTYTTSPTLKDKKTLWSSFRKDSKKSSQPDVNSSPQMQVNSDQIYFSNSFPQNNIPQAQNTNMYEQPKSGFYPPPPSYGYMPQNNAGNPFVNNTIYPAPQRQNMNSEPPKGKKNKPRKKKNSAFKNTLLSIVEWMRMSQNSSAICLFIILPILFILSYLSSSYIFKVAFFIAVASAIVWLVRKKNYSEGVSITLVITYITLLAIVIINMLTAPRPENLHNKEANNNVIVHDSPVPNENLDQNINITIPGDESENISNNNEEYSATETRTNFEDFMSKWQNSDIEGMLDYVAPSWKNQQKEPTQALFALLLNRRPKDYTIEDISGSESDSARTVTMRAEINKFTSEEYSLIRFQILMLKEQGIWYVDPSTLGTNIRPTPTLDPNTTFTPTIAPRTTVTPKPEGDTVIYYNPDGGSKYHLDPECPSVNKKYLPLVPFTFAQIHEPPYNKLTNCLECNAPH